MATVYEQNLANLSKNLGIYSLQAPQLSSNPFSNIYGGQEPSSSLSSSMGIPQGVGLSGEASIPLGNGSAQNSNQRAQKEQSNLQKAFAGVQSLYSPTGGRPIAGSEDVRVKSDVYGRPYTVVSISPRDEKGNRYSKEGQMSFGITQEQKDSSRVQMGAPQGQIARGSAPLKIGGTEPSFNPFAKENQAQMQEYNKRKQSAMSGNYGTNII
jgi:hypothetical protein